jgi:hypothetical protein
VVAALAAFTFVAASCGSDDGGGDSTEAPADTAATGDTEAPAETAATEDTDAPAETDATEDTDATEGTDGGGESSGGGLADDSVFGNGSEAWETAVMTGESSPLEAEGDPYELFMVNLEGSPGGSFPEVREGLEIGVEYINTVLGGVGADLAAGTPGAPLSVDTCAHALDPAEAQACATESVAADPTIIVKGIDFFSAVMWPVWEGQYPVIDTLPIFVADFVSESSLAMSGGCVVAFPGAAKMMVETLGKEKIAIIYSDNGPGQECWADTQERFYEYYAQENGIEYLGIPDIPGDPSDNDANVQTAINFIGDANGAIHYGIQAADCAEYADALDAAGNTSDVFMSGSCEDDAVKSAPSATGKYFGFTGPPSPSNAELLAEFDPFWQWEVAQREELLIAGEPDSPLSTFMRLGFNTAVMAYQVLNDFIAEGGDPNDHQALIEFMGSLENQHRVGGAPLDCANKVAEWAAICDFNQFYLQWDGTTMVADPALGYDVADPSTWDNVSELLGEVATAVPRQN